MARALLLMLCLQCCLVPYATACNSDILVLYPEVERPYQKVYEQIIEGIKSTTSNDLHTLALPQNHDPDKVQRWLDEYQNSANCLVVLGRRALKVSRHLRRPRRIVAGAVDILPGKDRVPGVSVRIHPADYLTQLRRLSPNSTHLVVFYNDQDQALVPAIDKEAGERGIIVTSIPVADAASAARRIATTFKDANPANTALWFTRNVIELNTELLYPYILEESWNRRIPVFSGMLNHTKRGFLFSLYPDYQGIGRELGFALEEQTQAHHVAATRFTHAANFALNIRTLQHLGLTLDETTLTPADTVYPAWQTLD